MPSSIIGRSIMGDAELGGDGGDLFPTYGLVRTAVVGQAIVGSTIVGRGAIPTGDVSLDFPSIESEEAFGTLTIIFAQVITFDGIATLEVFGTLRIQYPQSVAMAGIATEELFGDLGVIGPREFAWPSILSEEAFGVMLVAYPRTRSITGIATDEAFGTLIVGFSRGVMLPSILDGERFGELDVQGGKEAVRIFIGGLDRSAWLLQGSSRVSSRTMGRWSATFNLQVNDASWSPVLGQTVVISDYGHRIFAGCLNEVVIDRLLCSDSNITFRCSALDKSFICDHRVVTSMTIAEGTDVADAFRQVAAAFLDGEGVSIAALPASIDTVDSDVVLNFVTVTSAFDSIGQAGACNWWIDSRQQLRVAKTTTANVCPFALTETSKNWRALVVKTSLRDFINKAFVRSNLSTLPTTSGVPFSYVVPQAEATARGFWIGSGVLPLPAASIIELKVNGVVKTVYNGLTSPEVVDAMNPLFGHVWWIYPDSAYLAPPGSTTSVPHPAEEPHVGDLVEVKFIPTVSSTVATSSPTLFAPSTLPGSTPGAGASLATCGSGLYEAVRQVNDVSNPADLAAMANAIVARFGAVPETVDFETDQFGAAVGDVLTVNLPKVYVPTKTLFITSVEGASMKVDLLKDRPDLKHDGRGNSFRFKVSAATVDLGDWLKWFERLYRRSEHPNPVERESLVTFIIAPGASVTSGTVETNPKRVTRTQKLSEAYAVAGVPPTDQTLLLNIMSSGLGGGFLLKEHIRIPAGSAALASTTVFFTEPAFVFKNDILTPWAAYEVTGADPSAAGSVSLDLVGIW